MRATDLNLIKQHNTTKILLYISSDFQYVLLSLKGRFEVVSCKISGSLLLNLLSNDKLVWLIIISYHFRLASNSCQVLNILKL